MPELCPTQLIDDAPAKEDAFESHSRIAETIAQLIEETPGGKSIGLSGTWGAGKSSIVHMLQQRYDKNPDRAVWIFDAWSHEGDPLRRTFLERLVDSLQEKGWLDKTTWEDDLAVLARRRKVTDVRSTPQLSTAAVLIAGSLLLVPIGSAVFSAQIRNGVTLDPRLPIDWMAAFGLALLFAPALALAVACARVFRDRKKERPLRDALLEALNVFVRQTEANSRTETMDSGEPTSLEFENVFMKIAKDVLSGNPARRLVMVVDNLDRVGTEQALAVWSTLQTFLQRRGEKGTGLEQLWCVLPFDADAIARLWQQDKEQSSTIAESFLDKTFQLRFDVPPPRLAHWKDYLMKTLKEAMKEHGEDEFFRIYRLFTVRRTGDWTAPTPRLMKLFVNQVGSLHRQWQHRIPLQDLAYYVLLQKEGVPIVAQLLSGTLPDPKEAGLVSDSVRHSLAALAYGSQVEQSHELLLRQPILDALEQGDPGRLTELSRVSDTFWLVLEPAIDQGCSEWPRAEGGKLLHAAFALDKSQILGKEPQWRLDLLLDRLSVAVIRTQKWVPLDDLALEGMLCIGKRDSSRVPVMRDAFVKTRFDAEGYLTPETLRSAVSGYVRLARAFPEPQPRKVLVPRDLDAYAPVATALVAEDREGAYWANFEPGNPSNLMTQLAQTLGSPGWADAIRIANAAGLSEWTRLVQDAATALRANEGYSRLQVLELLRALHILSERDDAHNALAELVTSGRALECALKAIAGPNVEPGRFEGTPADPDLLWAWVFTMLMGDAFESSLSALPSGIGAMYEQPFQWLQWKTGSAEPDFVDGVAKVAADIGHASILMRCMERLQYSSRLYSVVRVILALADRGAPARVLPVSLVLDHWGRLGPYDGYAIARSMRSHRSDVEDILAAQPFEARLGQAYAGVLDAEGDRQPSFVAMCVDGVQSAAEDEWATSFDYDKGLMTLVVSLRKRKVEFTLASTASDTLLKRINKLPAKGELDVPILSAEMWQAFEASQREALLDAALRAFIVAKKKARGSLLGMVGDVVFEPAILRTPSLLEPLARHVLEEFEEQWMTALARAVQADPSLMQGLSVDARKEIVELAMRGQAKRNVFDEAKKAAANLATAFGGLAT